MTRHKGMSNGQLFKSYPQFVKEGINRSKVSLMIKIGESLGLLRVKRESGAGKPDLHDASAYMLTYLPYGNIGDVPPTDDRKRIRSDEQALQIVERHRKRKSSRKKMRSAA